MRKAILCFLVSSCLLISCANGNNGDSTGPSKADVDIEWVRSISSSRIDNSEFIDMAVDDRGYIYAAGYIYGSGLFSFGDKATAAGPYNLGTNAFIAKYAPDGTAQWARTMNTCSSSSVWDSIAVDRDGNVYVIGRIGEGSFDLGDGVTITGTASNDNPLIAKYDDSGIALWAETVEMANNYSPPTFSSIAVGPDGSPVVAGHVDNCGTCVFGELSTLRPADNNTNILIVRYDSSGEAIWARTVLPNYDYPNSSYASAFNSVATDAAGNVYAAGYLAGYGTCYFDDEVGATVANAVHSQKSNIVLVKYDSTGKAVWAQPATTDLHGGSSTLFESCLSSVASDGFSRIAVAGYICSTFSYALGNDKFAAGENEYSISTLTVQYDMSGNPLASCVNGCDGNAPFAEDLAFSSDGGVVTVGKLECRDSGNWPTCMMLIKSSSSGRTEWSKFYYMNDGLASYLSSVAADDSGGIYAAGYFIEYAKTGLIMKLSD
jgi:hypothetical protein